MRFVEETSGAVTVDWVVLTAALVGLGLATMAVVSAGVEDSSNDIDAQLRSDHIRTSFAKTPLEIHENYVFEGCPAGRDGLQQFWDAHFQLDVPEDQISYDHEPEDLESVIANYESDDNTILESNLATWRSDYANRPENFGIETSNLAEMAVVECIAAERGITL